MSSWTWVAKTLKNLKLATPAAAVTGPAATQQSRSPPLMSAVAVPAGGLSIPAKPKKPLSPYFRFIGQVREDVKKENPNLKVTDLMKKIAQRWDKLEDSRKESFMLDYKKEMVSYTSILDQYKKSLTPEQRDLEQQLKLDKQLQKEKREKRKRLRELGKPKKPASGFILFLMSKVPQGATILEHQNAAKEWGPRWKAMTDAQKQPHVQKYQEELIKYEKELSKWEQKMMKQGNEDLVRLSHLPKAPKKAAAKS